MKSIVLIALFPVSALAADAEDKGALVSAAAYVEACRGMLEPPDDIVAEMKSGKVPESELAVVAMGQMFCDGVATSVARTVASEHIYRYGNKRICVAPSLSAEALTKAMFVTWDKRGDPRMNPVDLALETLADLSDCEAFEKQRSQ